MWVHSICDFARLAWCMFPWFTRWQASRRRRVWGSADCIRGSGRRTQKTALNIEPTVLHSPSSFQSFHNLLLEASHSLVEPNVTLFIQQLSSFFSPNYSNHQHEGLRRCFHHRFRRCRLGRPSQVRSHELLQHVQAC